MNKRFSISIFPEDLESVEAYALTTDVDVVQIGQDITIFFHDGATEGFIEKIKEKRDGISLDDET